MYEQFFGLNESPFQLSPDPSFMFSSRKSREALASISYAIARRKGFVVMTGEVGTGKTLILRCLFELWEREQIPFAYFIGPKLSTNDFLRYITLELGIQVKDATKGNMLRALYGFLLTQFEKGLTTVLIIDEAHQMPRTVLEEIRVLANFETSQQKLLQVVLVGQPELEKRLDLVELRSLKQRIAVRCRLEPLGEEEIRPYVERRLELAGADLQSASIFPDETIEAVYRYSAGIPRLVNSICDQALITASKRQVRTVPVEIINEVATDFRLGPAPDSNQTEKVSAPAHKVNGSMAGKSSGPAAAASVAGMKALHTETPPTPLMAGRATPAQTMPATMAESSYKSGRRIAVANETRRKRFASGLTWRVTWPTEIRRWLEPGLRLSIVIITAGLLPVALAAGYFMARHQKMTARTLQEVTNSGKTSLFAQTAPPIQPAAILSAKRIVADPVDPIASRSDHRTAKSNVEPGDATSHAKIVMGALSRPVLKSRARSAPVPPLIPATQPKPLDLGRDLLQPSVPLPPTAVAQRGAQMQPAKSTPSLSLPSDMVSPASPAQSASEGVPQLQPARLISAPPPDYPLVARMTKVGGAVVIEAAIDETGKVTDMKVISGSPLLINAAVEALRRWKYEPARLNGRPTATHAQVRINFHIR